MNRNQTQSIQTTNQFMKLSCPILITVLFFTFFQNICVSQTKEIDSLKNILTKAQDTSRINLLIALGKKTRRHNKEKALGYLSKSLSESRQIGFIKGEISSLFQIALSHGMTGSYAESLDYFNQSVELSTEHQDYKRTTEAYNNMGIVYKRIGDYPSSKNFYLKSLKLIDSLDLPYDTSSNYLNLGVLYDLLDDPEMAMESYKTALEVYDGPDRASLENTVLSNLAVMDYSNKEYGEALEKFLKAVKYDEQHNSIDLSNTYSNIGFCYLYLKQYDKSEEYFLKSLDLANQLSIKHQIAIINYGLADLKLKQNRLDDATDYSKKNLKAVTEIGSFDLLREAHQKAFEIYNTKRQYPEAIEHLTQSMAYTDSLFNETKVRELQNLQVKHDVYLKDREIKESKLELALLNTRVEQNRKRTLYLIVISILLLFSASLLYFRYSAKKKSNAILSEKNRLISEQRDTIGQMNRQLEKRMLRAQMNPHFIFNSLGSIQHLISTNDKKGALTYLSKFSKLLRQVLESSVNISLVLSEEIELLKIYVELEALRFDHSFTYQFEIDENLDIDAHEVPMLLVQPYIENAIIHGLMPKEGNKELKVSFSDKGDDIECVIEDNGVGLTQTEARKSNRISRGMSITERRIQALKQHSAQQLVKIENLNDENRSGTRVTIVIPKE